MPLPVVTGQIFMRLSKCKRVARRPGRLGFVFGLHAHHSVPRTLIPCRAGVPQQARMLVRRAGIGWWARRLECVGGCAHCHERARGVHLNSDGVATAGMTGYLIDLAISLLARVWTGRCSWPWPLPHEAREILSPFSFFIDKRPNGGNERRRRNSIRQRNPITIINPEHQNRLFVRRVPSDDD